MQQEQIFHILSNSESAYSYLVYNKKAFVIHSSHLIFPHLLQFHTSLIQTANHPFSLDWLFSFHCCFSRFCFSCYFIGAWSLEAQQRICCAGIPHDISLCLTWENQGIFGIAQWWGLPLWTPRRWCKIKPGVAQAEATVSFRDYAAS